MTPETGLPIAPDSPWLAPMAGFSDLPFRLLCREQGAAAACTEMVSAKGLHYGGRETGRLLATCPEDFPLVVQLFGSEPELLQGAVHALKEQGFEYFDLNAGCPVRKVVKTGAGAALMENPALLAESAGAMVRAAGQGKVGVKMRLGSMPGRETFIEAAARLRDAGAAWLTLHPRHASQGYSGTADWSSIRELTSATDLPVIASGDLMTAEQADRCLGETGASAVMFARGALRDPAVFRRLHELRAGIPPQPRSAGEIIELVLRHTELARTHAPGRRALLKMRTAVPKYVKGFQEASIMRKELVRIDSWRELEDLLRNRLKEKPEEIDSKVS